MISKNGNRDKSKRKNRFQIYQNARECERSLYKTNLRMKCQILCTQFGTYIKIRQIFKIEAAPTTTITIQTASAQ